MADKSNTVSKKTIIAIVTVIVLLFIAGLSVGIFLADKGRTEAVDGSQSSSETQTAEENKANEDNTTANDNKNTENNTVANNNENAENNTVANDNGNTENNTVANNNGNAGNNGNNAGANNNPNTANATNNTEVTTNTDVNQVGETTVTRVEEQEKLVSRDFWDWWTPSSVIAVNSAVADKIIPQTPDFTVEKTATTGVGEEKLVYANKNITYTIKVTNNGEQELKDIEITDKVPEQTTFVSIDDAQNSGTTILKNDTVIGLKWIVTVPAKESIEVKFTVKVNENATGTISNAAIVNGKDSNEEKTSIINAKKSSKIIERNNVEVKDGLEVAKLGDKIKYTITATNTGDVLGKITIEDTIPVGTELIESSVTDSGKVTTTTDNRKQISWDVELDGNSTIERTFIVEVKDISGEIENVATVGGVPTNPDKKDTADIKVVKEVVGIKRDKENLELDAKVKAGDVIEYKITVTNTGSADLTNVVLDEKLVGIEIDAKDLQIGNLKAGEYKEIFATYTVSYEKDIKEKADRTIINNVEVTGETTPQPGKETEKVTDKDKTTTPVEEFQDVEVVKATTQTEKVKVGDTVNYTIKVKNTGNVTLTNVSVTDKITLAAGDETLDIYSDAEYKNKVTEIAKLEVGEEVTLYAKYEVKQSDIDAQKQITNVATANGTDSNEVPVTPEDERREVEVVKATTQTEKVKVGDTVNYTIKVKNTGNVTLTKVSVTDRIKLAAGDETLDIYSDAEYKNKVTEIAKLEVGEEVTLYAKYTVKQSDIDAQKTITNVATANGKDSNEVPVTPEDERREVEVVKATTQTEKVKAGDTVNYTIKVKNTGNVTLTKVSVTDRIKLAAGDETLDIYSDAEYKNKVTEIAKLEVGEEVTLYAKYTVKQSDIDAQKTITNVATANGKDSNEVPVTPEDERREVEVVKATTQTEKVKVGDTVNYTIKVKNTGNVTLTKVSVTDKITLAAGDETLDIYSDAEYKNKVTEIAKLEVGEEVTLYAKYTVKQSDIDAQKTIINVATVGTTPSNPVPVTPEDKIEKVEVVKATTQTEKVKAGDIVNYTIKVTNTGNVTLTNVPVTDKITLATGEETLDIYSDAEYKNKVTEIAQLKVGEEVTLYAKYEVKQADIDAQQAITNVATAGTTPSNPVPVTPEKSNPSMNVVKEADKTTVKAGDTVNYTIKVTNTGNVTLTNVPVTDKITLATGEETLDIYSDAEYKNKVTEIAQLKVGEEVTLYAKYEVKQADIDAQQAITNVATVGTTPSNPVPVTPEDKIEKVEVVKATTQKEKVKAGDIVNYTIKVTNTGNVTLTNVPVTDKITLAAGEETLDIYSDAEYKNKVTEIAQLKVGEEVTLYAKYEVKQADIDAQQAITNVATADTTPSNPVPVTPEKSNPSMNVVKEADKTTVKAGDTVNYTITVTNTGNVTLTNVPVTDKITLAAGEETLDIYSDAEYKNKVTEIAQLKVGDKITLYAKYEVTQADIDAQQTITNVATAGTTPSDPVPVTPEKSNPSMNVVKKADKTTVKAGDTVNYTITVTNTGNVTLTNVPVTDVLTTSKGTQNLTLYLEAEYKTPVTEIEKLEVGDKITLYAKYEVTQADIDAQQAITNVATAGTTPSEPVPVTPEKSNPSMNVVKEADKTTVKAGDTVNYTITVTNTGNVTLTNVPVTDVLTTSKGTQNLTLYLEAEYKTPVTEIEKLEVGDKITLYAKYEVTQADIDAQQAITNVATAGTTPSNPVPVTPENKFGYRVEYYYENDEQDVQGAVTVDGKVFVLNETIYSSEDVTFGGIITDYEDKTITGYEFYKVTPTNTADPTKSALVITANEENNVIRVYYVKKTYTYKVEHYIQNLDGTWPEKPEDTDTIDNVKYGDIAGYEENSYTGFTFDDSLTKQENGIIDGNGNITVPDNNNLVIKLYYTRNKYQYVVNYLKLGTNEVLHEPKEVNDIPFGTVITSSDERIDIPGYNYHHVEPNSIKIAAEGNVINIYYTENIKTAQIVEKSTTIRKTNLVLVLDLSSSMENGTTRLRDAKTAANKFIDQIYNNKNISGINIKVVTFNTRNPILEGVKECSNEDHYERLGFGFVKHKSNGDSDEYDGCVKINGRWYSETKTADYSGTQVLSTTLDNNTATNYQEAQKLKDAISNIYIPKQYKKGGYGTHIYAALQEANTQINNLKQEYANNDNVVVFLGDGMPTEIDHSGYGDNSIANIQSAASTLKSNSVVYCIRLGNEAQKSTVFGDIATSSDKIIDANDEGDLIAGFDAITSKENTRNDTANSSNGIITIEADLDITKPIEVTKPDGTTATYNSVEELNASGFISYNTANKTFTWNVLNYPNNITLNISYSVN